MAAPRTALVVVGALCGLLAVTGARSEPPPGMPGPGATKTSTASNGDAEVLAKLIAINQHEINAAKLAEKKKVSRPVQEFAQMLREQHDRNLRDTQDLAKQIGVRPHESAECAELKKHNSSDLKTLKSLEGPEFESKFLDAMVNGHQEVLRVLDGSISEAQNAQLKQHLQATRERVATHLAEAQRLENTASSARK